MAKFGEHARAVLHTSMGDMTIEFLPGKAPRTCDNFVKLARAGFYDGLTFHRVVKGFMVQGGCPKGNGTGGPGYTIGPEFSDVPHTRGTVSMARSNDPHSAGSQFFIVHDDARYLDHKYSAFARLVEGDEVLDRIAAVRVTENRFREPSQPLDPIYINRIDLIDVELDEEPAPARAAAGAGAAQPSGAARAASAGATAERESRGGGGRGGEAQGRAEARGAEGPVTEGSIAEDTDDLDEAYESDDDGDDDLDAGDGRDELEEGAEDGDAVSKAGAKQDGGGTDKGARKSRSGRGKGGGGKKRGAGRRSRKD